MALDGVTMALELERGVGDAVGAVRGGGRVVAGADRGW